ncbi:Receptor-like serine/threonine-protein kinase ALE2 [Linum perenne]
MGLLLVVIWALSVHGFSVLGSAATPTLGKNTRHGSLAAVPPSKHSHSAFSMYHSRSGKAAHSHDLIRPSSISLPPSSLAPHPAIPAGKEVHSFAHSPSSVTLHRSNHERRGHFISPIPSFPIPPNSYSPSISPLSSPSSMRSGSVAPAFAPMNPSHDQFNMHVHSPATSPLGSFLKKIKAPPPPPKVFALPPPPPNEDCGAVTCTDPLTYTPSGSPCGCVWPIQVKLGLDVAIYTFFTLVTELAEEIAASVALNYSQVRIMGANADHQQMEKSTVLISLVPREVRFDYTTALSIYNKFWSKQVVIKDSFFGAYEVLYVDYPGLPPSPPTPTSISTIDDGPYAGRNHRGIPVKPLGVNVPTRRKNELGGGIIAIIVVSSFAALIMCLAIVWFLVWKSRNCIQKPEVPSNHAAFPPSPKRPIGTGGGVKVLCSSASLSSDSGTLTYTGSAKTFTLREIERATDNFKASRVLGEGGFGIVYSGTLENGKEVAVKVLKRYDQHGSREFLAEVEMLSRLHHRNLVKLIGTCSEGHTRCLVYELIPNGSLESHLHGTDKDSNPLDWDARMKIALGAARALAYLHEDSSPRVIHRDFKASNILLEHDSTPKVSDFGLARAAIDEGNKHISTHVMGTFGYLAPEYAMTGHLLVKSDVYSYGVVLLELLTGRKPVDLSQPAGEENLVAYARPLLTSREGLEALVDPAIKYTVSFDTIARVAAIASMCVQPEVSHRPFMGEVVQALKLISNEFDVEAEVEEQRVGPSHDNLLMEIEMRDKGLLSCELMDALQSHCSHPLSTSDLLSSNIGLEEGQYSESQRTHSSSGPLTTGRKKQLWQMFRGSRSEHGFPVKITSWN